MTLNQPFHSADSAALVTPPASRSSFWTRIATDLADAIAGGVYTPGQRLPSEHMLARQFGVNRHTIRRSLASLCSQGLLRATQGSGTYVEDFAVELVLSSRTRHRQNLALVGMKGSLQVLSSNTLAAEAPVAAKLRVAVGTPLLALQVLAEADGLPISLSQRYFPAARFPQLEQVLRETGSLTRAFAAHGVADYTRQESRIATDMPDAVLAGQLHMPVSRPVLRVDSLNVDTAGVPIEWARAWLPGDRVALSINHTCDAAS